MRKHFTSYKTHTYTHTTTHTYIRTHIQWLSWRWLTGSLHVFLIFQFFPAYTYVVFVIEQKSYACVFIYLYVCLCSCNYVRWWKIYSISAWLSVINESSFTTTPNTVLSDWKGEQSAFKHIPCMYVCVRNTYCMCVPFQYVANSVN